jgi:hypothetical protein
MFSSTNVNPFPKVIGTFIGRGYVYQFYKGIYMKKLDKFNGYELL